jgi:hypothetical protein
VFRQSASQNAACGASSNCKRIKWDMSVRSAETAWQMFSDRNNLCQELPDSSWFMHTNNLIKLIGSGVVTSAQWHLITCLTC